MFALYSKTPRQITYNLTLYKNQIKQPIANSITSLHKKYEYTLRYDTNNH